MNEANRYIIKDLCILLSGVVRYLHENQKLVINMAAMLSQIKVPGIFS
jgi:hypothetical protein